MDRYRRFDRERDDHPDVEYFGAGESYRPGGQTGEGPYRPPGRDRPAVDSWTSDRREPRRDERRDEIDSYIPATSSRAQRPRSRSPPGGYRRRSRTPPARDRGDLFPSRARSPPRRYSPRREDRARSPPRRRSRSPYSRPRSPPDPKRGRDYSADSRRSPPRERKVSLDKGRYDKARSPPRRPYSPSRDSPRAGGYRPRSRTPPRRDVRKPAHLDDNWRRRSPSPRAVDSTNTSRRSSPPIHPDRTSLSGSGPRSPPYQAKYDSRETGNYRAKSPPPRDSSPMQDVTYRDRDVNQTREVGKQTGEASQPPSGPSATRNGTYDRPPPSGPSRGYGQASQTSPPTGPAASSMPMSAHNRATPPSAPRSTPTGPRGVPPGRIDGPARDFSNPALRGRSSLTYRAPTAPRSTSYGEGPPSGPRSSSFSRGDFGSGGRGDYGGSGTSYRGGFGRGSNTLINTHNHSHTGSSSSPVGMGNANDANYPFRPTNSSTSMTYPRTQRFNTTPVSTLQTHLQTVEKIIPGGKLYPSAIPPEQEKKLKLLEAEAEKIRVEIAEKQKSKREAINEWDIRERESERDALRSELAESSLQKLTEGVNSGIEDSGAFGMGTTAAF